MTTHFPAVAALFLSAAALAANVELSVEECDSGFCSHGCRKHELPDVDTCVNFNSTTSKRHGSHKVTCTTRDHASCGHLLLSIHDRECRRFDAETALVCDQCFEYHGKKFEKTVCDHKHPERRPEVLFDCDEKCEKCSGKREIPLDGRCFHVNHTDVQFQWVDTFECSKTCQWSVYNEEGCKQDDLLFAEEVPVDACLGQMRYHGGDKSFKLHFHDKKQE